MDTDPPRTAEQARRVYLVADQLGRTDDEIEELLCGAQSISECDQLISRLARELLDRVRGLSARRENSLANLQGDNTK